MRVLVACEFSGVVREAFRAKGHCAHSADLLGDETPWNRACTAKCGHCSQSLHYYGDLQWSECRQLIWDLVIAFPPCTHLASSGARWFKDKQAQQDEAIRFVKWLAGPAWIPDTPRIAIENPIGVLSTRWRKPDQIIQPWMFGHGEVKATCLWLKGLPKLTPTNIVEGRRPRVHHESPGPDRWKRRSRTLPGIAEAMAAQWGGTN